MRSICAAAVRWAAALVFASTAVLSAQQSEPAKPAPAQGTAPQSGSGTASQTADDRSIVFHMGEIVVVGTPDGAEGVGGSVLTRREVWTFDRNSLDQAVNIVPGVVSTFDSNGRRNESDIFVRGFGRWQVPLTMDGVRIYLPADNRLDFSRFLTSDIAAVQIQKGYASVLDGPGGMGGAINLVTRKPTKALEVEGTASLGGRSSNENWNGYAMIGTRQRKYYLQASANYADRDFWTLSSDYQPTGNSLQAAGRRQSSDTSDARVNVKGGFTPNDTDEYTVNFTKQWGEKGAPLNVYNNPPVPVNSYWRWPWWDVQNTSFLSRTQLSPSSYVKTKLYYNVFQNALDAFDDATYASQSLNNRFHSPYDDHAYGISVELGALQQSRNTLKAAAHYRADFHKEQQTSQPTNPNTRFEEPVQEQSQGTWSIALEDTVHVRDDVELVGGVSYDSYDIRKAEEFNTATRTPFEFPKGGSDAFNWQSALIWHYAPGSRVYASVSDRARFPMIFELYSSRFGTNTPNPDLGPERATNVELGWKGRVGRGVTLEGAVFYSDVRKLIQTIVLPDTTTQFQNVGNGEFYGVELAADVPVTSSFTVGGNYTKITRRVHDALLPDLRPTGVPDHKGFLYAAWQPVRRLTITPSIDAAGDRWSDVNPAPAFPYVRTGAYTLVNLSAEYAFDQAVSLVFGFKNLNDENYELAWGFPQPGRTFYVKTRIGL